ncbi:radical SAM protein [Desulfovibrio inopinatus]|uniref:radical SAM protein n=1 Tax=Desulfovibrio inopinatus TaxID=102109 RepID=UPI00040EC36E|nr:radical SAM protein [Desulfovibrio inopinatus]
MLTQLFSSSDSRRSVFSTKTLASLAKGRIPGQVVVQYTDHCNASCAQCAMRVSNDFPRTKLDVDQVRRLLDAMAERNVQAVSFTGGEPLLYLDEIVSLINHAAQVGIQYIRTGTNGFLFRGSNPDDFEKKIHGIAEKLAATSINTFWVSVDSADPETHETNRGLRGIVRNLERGLSIFREYGLYPSANLGINRLTGGPKPIVCRRPDGSLDADRFRQEFTNAFARFYEFVEGLGFTIVNACYPMSLDADEAGQNAVYAATSEDDFIRFSAEEKPLLFQALMDTVPTFRDRLRVFTPRSSLLSLIRQYQGQSEECYGCRGGIDFFFIDSKDMNTYPCGYRGGENLGKFWDLDLHSRDTSMRCLECDWECFRDPSELIGPLLDLRTQPFQLAKRCFSDKTFFTTWLEDVRYYRACGYFNARTAPDYAALARFRRV